MHKVQCENCGKMVSAERVDDCGVCFGCCHERCPVCGDVNHLSQMTEEITGKNAGLMVCCGCEAYTEEDL